MRNILKCPRHLIKNPRFALDIMLRFDRLNRIAAQDGSEQKLNERKN